MNDVTWKAVAFTGAHRGQVFITSARVAIEAPPTRRFNRASTAAGGCVYSAAKENPSMSLEWCRKPEVGLPRPDLCLFLDISAEDAAKRGGYGTEKYEKKEMQDRVRGLFETMMQKKEGEDFVRIDAGEGMKDVAAKIRQEVDRCIERVAKGQMPLRTVEEW
ncbi:hypothetical protein IG631_04248 [Alternaria alternata]|nr:hypothetical protein IG631_04248 [Alternaria alternata]